LIHDLPLRDTMGKDGDNYEQLAKDVPFGRRQKKNCILQLECKKWL